MYNFFPATIKVLSEKVQKKKEKVLETVVSLKSAFQLIFEILTTLLIFNGFSVIVRIRVHLVCQKCREKCWIIVGLLYILKTLFHNKNKI